MECAPGSFARPGGIMLPVTDSLRYALNPMEEPNDSAGRYASGAPPVTIWNITNTCNMACPHCYSAAKRVPTPDELSHDDAMLLVDHLADAGIRVLIFSGGEPLLRPDAVELISRAASRGIMCQLSTNGVLITRDTATKLRKAGVRYVGVSIDGLPEINDSYRALENAYARALEGLRASIDAGMEAGLRITVSGFNAQHVHPLLDLCLQERIGRFYISHLVYGGRGVGFSRNDLRPADARSMMESVFDRAYELLEDPRPMKIVTGGNDSDGVALYLYVRRRFGEGPASRLRNLLERRGGNSAGEKVINIDHKGDVHPDQFWRTMTMGNVMQTPLSEILKTDIAQKLKNRTAYLHGKCSECQALAMCRGSHRERAEVAFGDIWADDPSCILSGTDHEALADAAVAMAGVRT